MEPTYGTSQHYLGEQGKQYFSWQNQGDQTGRIESRKFLRYIKPTDRILDFGCGNGSLLKSLKCTHRIGVEINPHARAFCQEQGVEVYSTLHEIGPASVNLVISNHALEHVPNPLGALQQMNLCLVQGGRLILCLPFDDWRSQQRYQPGDINRHFYTWSPQLIGNLLDEAGFEIQNAWVYTHAWPSQWSWLDQHLPVKIFDWICTVYAWKHNRRQIFAEAIKRVDA